MLAALLLAAVAEFANYPAATKLAHRPAALKLTTRAARRYRSVLRDEAKKGPNFNGHYRVADWGCGTNCVEWGILDLDRGKVWMAPKPLESCWTPNLPEHDTVTDWFEMHLDSRLLYVHDCVSNPPVVVWDRRRVFEWRGGKLRLLRTETLKEPDDVSVLHR
jgi:hypothetical protein